MVGGLFFGHSEVGVFSEEAEAIVTGIAAQAAIALDNASLFDESTRSGEALRRSNSELKRLNEDLNQFAYSASHDLREPLRMVSIYTQFLGENSPVNLTKKATEFLEHILKGAERMEALVRDLLAYTQASEPSEALDSRADGNEALRRAIANLGAVIEESGAKIDQFESSNGEDSRSSPDASASESDWQRSEIQARDRFRDHDRSRSRGRDVAIFC